MARDSAAWLSLAVAAVAAWYVLSTSAFIVPVSGWRGSPQETVQGLPSVQFQGQSSEGRSTPFLATGAACALLMSGIALRTLSVGRSSSPVARRAIPIAINGFGRIGRQVARIAMKAEDASAAAVGSELPDVELDFGFPPDTVNIAERTKGKRVILVGLPGAFTPT